MTSLAEIYDDYRADPAFDHLRTEGIVLVPGEGSSRPKLFIVGEAPGATENTTKRPFQGASGKVLRSLITDVAQLQPEDYFITNVVKYRPAGNRTPVPYEISRSTPYLRREWASLGRPSVIVAVGGTAKNAFAPQLPSVTASAGQPWPLRRTATLWPMLHPAYGLRNPTIRPQMEQHWEYLGEWLRKEGKL
jgi:DNA polymerase